MILVLFRHGHKAHFPLENPPLSEAGFEQAHKIAQKIKANILPRPVKIWVSPKQRTTDTMSEVLNMFHPQIETLSELNTRQNSQTLQNYRDQVLTFIEKINTLAYKEINASNPSLVATPEFVHFACTHYDWLEEAMTLIPCTKSLTTYEFSSWAPAQYLIFKIKDHQWELLQKGLA